LYEKYTGEKMNEKIDDVSIPSMPSYNEAWAITNKILEKERKAIENKILTDKRYGRQYSGIKKDLLKRKMAIEALRNKRGEN
jgi:hypothetical protein